MARTIDTVLFDLDGTLIDSIPLIRASYLHTLTVHRGGEQDPAMWYRGLGRPLRWHFGQITADPEEVEAMIATYRQHNHARLDAVLVDPLQELEVPVLRQLVAELDHLPELVGRVDMQQREGNPSRREGLLREAQHRHRVLADAEEHDGLVKLGDDLADDMDALRFQLGEMGQVVLAHVRGKQTSPRVVLYSTR
jgi:hypothetical protein